MQGSPASSHSVPRLVVPLLESFFLGRRALLWSICLLAECTCVASAQEYIFGRADLPVGTESVSIAAADFNGDGMADLVVPNAGDATVSILLGTRDGAFSSQAVYPTGANPVSITIGDFNGDGNMDIAVATDCSLQPFPPGAGCGAVSILLGNGDGSFQPHIEYGIPGRNSASIITADFNRDGKLDLAVINNSCVSSNGCGASNVAILLGNGDGTFQAQVTYGTPDGPKGLAIGDFNVDGKLDIAIATGSGVSVLLGNGNGTFQSSLNSTGGPGGTSIAAGDFDKDGKLDVLITDGVSTVILLGNGDGTFRANATYSGGSAVAVSDLNGDGNLDLILTLSGTHSPTTTLSVLLGNGNGTFQSPQQYGTGSYPAALVLADLNGDGKQDAAVAAPGCVVAPPLSGCTAPGVASVLLGLGTGAFVRSTSYQINSVATTAAVAADFDGDGALDLAAVPGVNSTGVSALLNNGSGIFGSPISSPFSQVPGYSLVAGDFRGNGKIDLATVFPNCSGSVCNPGSVGILLGIGDGTFQPPATYTVGLQPGYLAVGDVNADHKLDIVVANSGSDTVSVLLGNGDGTLMPALSFATAHSPIGEVAVGDFNADGRLDLAVATSASLSVLLGNGDGTFQPHVDYSDINAPFSIAPGDFNGDGKLDIAVGNANNQVVSIFIGNGDGTFKPAANYPQVANIGIVRVADFNGDGKLDLAIAADGSAAASVLLGNGDGSFQAPVTYFMGVVGTSSLMVGDFNHDGVPDWAVNDNIFTGALSVMLSTGFRAASPTALDFGSQGVGTTSPAQTITVANPSNVPITVTGVVVSANYTQTNNCAALSPGSSCTITVTFAPTGTGLQPGTITLTDSTPTSPQTISLTGTGVNGPFLSASPGRVNFAAQALHQPSSPLPVVLTNTGNASLTISTIAITGANSPDFGQTNNCGTSLSSGAHCALSVTFTPSAGGSRLANVSVSDNAPGSPQLVSLVGVGLGPVANFNPAQLTFASQAVGTTSTAQVVTLTNVGGAALNITQITASGDFEQTNTCSTSLAAGSSCQISVMFTPTATGNRVGSVTITDDAAGGSQTIPLTGTGSGSSLNLQIPSGSSSSVTVQAGQTGTYQLSIGGGTFSGTANLTCTGAPAGAACSVPATITVSTSAATPFTVSVSTTPRPVAALHQSNAPLTWLSTMAVALIAFFSMCAPKRRRWSARTVLGILLVGVLCSCGGGGGPASPSAGTPAGTYRISVTASSGSVSQSVALSLSVR